MSDKTFAGEDLYPGICLKAARLCFGIATNHAFVDGNKRVAVHAMEVFLLANGLNLKSTDDEMENIILGVAAGELSYKDLAIWIEKYISR
ncbi:type II toxin-antitoxin system death-on-curing family toxin [Selenomonas sp. KH1T6]|uniref:type II toxin-antitoxin system death-on-curing family toxin n=1 Tax=Selenomonas sp. KH1T6 TaxID=3158784 RepID=UPI000944E341